MEEIKDITKNEIKFDVKVGGIHNGEGPVEKILAAHLGDYTMFYILSKVGKIKSRTYIVRKGKTRVTDELEWDQLKEELKNKNYVFKKDKKGKVILEHNKRGIIRWLLSS